MSLFSRLDSSFLRRRPPALGPLSLAITFASFLLGTSLAAAGESAPDPESRTAESTGTETVGPNSPATNVPEAGAVEAGAVESDTASSEEAPGRSGMLVFVDPETGEIAEPTPEQEARMRGRVAAPNPLGLNKSSQGLMPFALDGGGRGVYLEKRFRSALRVQVLQDGSYEIRCTDHPDQPAGHQHGAVSPAAEAATDPAPES